MSSRAPAEELQYVVTADITNDHTKRVVLLDIRTSVYFKHGWD